MTPEKALQKLADGIWDSGEISSGNGCLVPSEYIAEENRDEENSISDALYKKYGATHFSRVWQLKGKFVRIQLWKREAFGACLDYGDIIHTETIKVMK
jgi:hypothetical protein